jgi:hypothetical protein
MKPVHPCNEVNHDSCEAQHDYVVSDPYRVLSYVYATHIFCGLV